MAAIFDTAFPLDQSFFGQLIDEDNHAAGENPEPFRQRPLIARGSGSDDAQDSGMAWSNAQLFDSLAKTISCVSAELGEEKGGAGWPLGFAGSHEFSANFKKLLARINRSYNERFMQITNISKHGHRGPPPGMVAIVYTLLFNAGLYFVVSFRVPEHLAASPAAVPPYFPGPWESAETIAAYFQTHPHAVLMCAFLQFGAAIPLGIFTATMVSRLQFLGVRAAGAHIALFGGLMTAFNIAVSALILWVMAYPGIAQETPVLRALYYLVFSIGGVGFSVPMGILIAGLSVPAAILKLLPKWLVVSGLVLGIIGELSALSLIIPQALFLIPLTRFPSFIWLIIAGFRLPTATERTST